MRGIRTKRIFQIPSGAVLDASGLLPDSDAARTPSGFTCTGLTRITRGQWKGCWMVSDDGRLVQGDASDYEPQVHILTPDFGRIIQPHSLPYSGASAQGSGIDTALGYDRFWVACSADRTIRHFNVVSGGHLGGDMIDLTSVDGNNITGSPNGLAYDAANHHLFVTMSDNATVYVFDGNPAASPRLVTTYTGDWGGNDNSDTPDQLWYDQEGGLYYSMGENGGDCGIYRFDLATETSTPVFEVLEDIQAIEGFVIDREKRLLWVVNDGGYHPNANPAFNMWAKFRIPALS